MIVLRKIGLSGSGEELSFFSFAVFNQAIIMLHIQFELFDDFSIMLSDGTECEIQRWSFTHSGTTYQYHIKGRITNPSTTNTDIDSVANSG